MNFFSDGTEIVEEIVMRTCTKEDGCGSRPDGAALPLTLARSLLISMDASVHLPATKQSKLKWTPEVPVVTMCGLSAMGLIKIGNLSKIAIRDGYQQIQVTVPIHRHYILVRAVIMKICTCREKYMGRTFTTVLTSMSGPVSVLIAILTAFIMTFLTLS